MRRRSCPRARRWRYVCPKVLQFAVADPRPPLPPPTPFAVPSQLEAHLPVSWQGHRWRQRYSLAEDGVSMETFFARARRAGPSLLVILTDEGEIFGGFASQSWHHSYQYFGTGESFLFRCTPEVTVFRWTGDNEFFMLGERNRIAMGGGCVRGEGPRGGGRGCVTHSLCAAAAALVSSSTRTSRRAGRSGAARTATRPWRARPASPAPTSSCGRSRTEGPGTAVVRPVAASSCVSRARSGEETLQCPQR